MKKRFWIVISLAALLLSACNRFLDQLPSGNYTDENYADYPALVRGYVEKAYSLRPSTYLSTPGMACDNASVSKNSSCDSQPRRFTSSFSISGIMA